MKTARHRCMLTGLLLMAVFCTDSKRANAADADPKVQARVDALLTAIEKDDAGTFTADATPTMKSAINPNAIHALSQTIGRRLASKHTATYLCELSQRGYHVYLWKLSFDDGGDDVIARLVLDNDKMLAGFFLQ